MELFEASGSPFVGTATVYDGSGAKQATVYTGQIADGVTSPVTRTMFESVPVPGLQDQPAPTAHYSFYVDRVNDIAKYRMHLTAGEPVWRERRWTGSSVCVTGSWWPTWNLSTSPSPATMRPKPGLVAQKARPSRPCC